MQHTELQYQRILGTDGCLRSAVAKAVTEFQLKPDGAGREGAAADLYALAAQVQAAVVAVEAGAAATVAAAPTIVSMTQAFGVAKIVVTFSASLGGYTTTSQWAVSSPARTVTGVAVVGNTVEVSYSGTVLVTADTPLLAFDAPAEPTLTSLYGVAVADAVAAAVTVAAS